jgi:hypothetical protein
MQKIFVGTQSNMEAWHRRRENLIGTLVLVYNEPQKNFRKEQHHIENE